MNERKPFWYDGGNVLSLRKDFGLQKSVAIV